VTYLAYCGSTGLETMDYRLTDQFMDPPGWDESGYSEKSIRLAHSYWCYDPVVDLTPEDGPPALKAGFVTFGCQNNFCKINPAVWSAWAQILRQTPGSKLLINCVEGRHRGRAGERLGTAGIDPQRLLFTDSTGPDYFRDYRRIDIALDPFPFGGGMTTCDAIWMGTPVVTLRGRTGVGRGGASILSNLGMPELIAENAQDYVCISVDLARDLGRLTDLRDGLRQRMERSPLMNAGQFAGDIESAYLEMWENWVRTRG
jgi:protein O-GlcNAc transferase